MQSPLRQVVIAILAKDKEHCLPLYLECLYRQTYPKDLIHLYIRTNNNNDGTVKVLREWLSVHAGEYASTFYDDSDTEEQVQKYGQHEWNSTRFSVLGKIRQQSVHYAQQLGAHYFVIDCDNFIKPVTLENLMRTNLPVVGPYLQTFDTKYSNFHLKVDENGYFVDSPEYHQVWNRDIKGLIDVGVIHCTYLIRYEFLQLTRYQDASNRYEYVIMSDHFRKQGVPQYLDTREVYGRLTFAETGEQMTKEDLTEEKFLN